MVTTITIVTSNLSAGIAAASQFSKRSLPEIVNTSAYWIAVNAKARTKRVTVKTIDSDLGTITTPKLGKMGQVLSQKYAKNKTYSGGKMGRKVTALPLAVLIVVARSNPQSRYNQATNMRYARASNPFKGVSRSAGRQAMRAAVDRLIKARHSSTSFLVASWIPIVRALAPHALSKYTRGGPSPADGSRNFYGAQLGTATPATEGHEVYVLIENLLGTTGILGPSHNEALWRHAAPALQTAIDIEGRQQMEYAMRKAQEELQQVTEQHWK